MLVMNVVSLPIYVKGTHLCVVMFVSLTRVVVGCLWVGGLVCGQESCVFDYILSHLTVTVFSTVIRKSTKHDNTLVTVLTLVSSFNERPKEKQHYDVSEIVINDHVAVISGVNRKIMIDLTVSFFLL
jgi:hypothetical protein